MVARSPRGLAIREREGRGKPPITGISRLLPGSFVKSRAKIFSQTIAMGASAVGEVAAAHAVAGVIGSRRSPLYSTRFWGILGASGGLR